MDAISQINVIVDHDSITDALSPNDLADQSSIAANAAAIVAKSVAAAREDADADADNVSDPVPDSTPLFSGTPANWTILRHDGPVTQINWVKQHSFTTDFDQAVVTFSGTATFLGLGENALSNSFNALEFGYQYDLIFVAGNLIDVNMIDQLNVILDSDVICTTAPAQAASAKPEPVVDMPTSEETAATLAVADFGAEHSGRVAPNNMVPDPQDKIQPDSVAQNANDQPAFLKGSGTNGSTQQVAATSGLPDIAPAETKANTVSPIEVADNEPVSLPDNPSPTPAPAVSSGDNLAYNQASIQTIGEDTDAAITDIFSDALDSFADGGDEISGDIIKDPVFTGTELLRVLYVDGDVTTVNMVEQINIIGDADQVHLARDNFAAALQNQIEITTGSNVAANIAAIQDNGLDSTVMARGKVYSDALIHQANLMDTDVLETGSSVAELTNEVVAFLTDDISADPFGDDIDAMVNGTASETFGQSDVMQTMLS
ncbi:hypothetical protein SAMN05444004_1267 [Jannaschia faecimaris]|uniref:Uncharacterized protein n=2 Tax=Jannaschia faecimaris TaxID=1244108 RepID=A0A1H3U8S6_9RHOB|nr:hypothetical protein SAMN05444004_1267 [Jannaschia faecimaris]